MNGDCINNTIQVVSTIVRNSRIELHIDPDNQLVVINHLVGKELSMCEHVCIPNTIDAVSGQFCLEADPH